jgi:hypothetical protein
MLRNTIALAAFASTAMLATASVCVPVDGVAAPATQGSAPVESSIPGTTGVSLNQPRGARGQTVDWRVKFTAAGQPVGDMPVAFFWRSDIQGLTPITTVHTGPRGIAKMHFRIPRNPGQDNVYLVAVSGGGPFTSVVEQRIAIAAR